MGYWIATIILALFACFGILAGRAGGGWLAYAAAACLALATGLLFPPFWRGGTNRTWRLARLVLVVLLTATALLLPIKTHVVKLDMPRPAANTK